MQIIDKTLAELTPYENNPRNNDEAVVYVAKSIKEFGFKVPIVIDQGGQGKRHRRRNVNPNRDDCCNLRRA